MGVNSRFQYALGFGLACALHLKTVQDVEESVRKQKKIIELIAKCQSQQITFRSDKPEPITLAKTFRQAYEETFNSWVFDLFNSTKS